MRKIRLLSIDDEPQVTNVFALLLSRLGFEVKQVNDPHAAIATALQFSPDVIISDVDMEGMDGGELASKLQVALPRPVPIIFLTSLMDAGESGKPARQMGGYPFLAKPIHLPQVLASIREQLALYSFCVPGAGTPAEEAAVMPVA